MHMKWLAWSLVPGLLIGAAGCPSIDKDEGEGVIGPTVEFDPSNSIVPFPNNLVLSADGTHVNLPAQCNEGVATTVIRNGVLNKLDGFGTYEVAMQVSFSDDVDPTTLNDQTVVLYKRASGLTGSVDAPSAAIPLIVIPGMTLQYPHGAPECGDPVMKMNATIVPRVPLDETSFYTAAVLKGVKTTTGEDYTASFTWALVRSSVNPVELDDQGNVTVNRTPLNPADPAALAQLQGINLLWNAHAKALTFLESKGHQRSDVLVAWEFRTQTTTDPLDPTVANSPAANVPTTPLSAVVSLTDNLDRTNPPFSLCPSGTGGDTNAVCFMKINLGAAAGASGAALYPTGNALCAAAGCAAIGNVIAGTLTSPSYQTDVQNAFDTTKPIPGQWNDPVHPTKVKDQAIQIFGFLPATPPPAGGYPFVVFGHGLGSTKKSLIAIAPSFAGSPLHFASIAIDFVGHDSRAVRTSNAAALGCADGAGGAPDPTQFPQCYAPFLSADLGATRDNFRQSVLDVQGLIRGLKACGLANCTAGATYTVPAFQVDTAHINYTGISLGGILGSMITATSPDIKASVLNVPGAGWLDILENTATKQISCALVDALIGAGVITGTKSDAPVYSMGTCLTDEWKTQPGYRTFSAIGRWVLDPADPANFNKLLAMKRILIQEVVGDLTVPNIATNNEAALVGLAAGVGDCGAPNPAPPPAMLPSAAITMSPTMNKFLKYTSVPPGTTGCTPGNDFAHPSLLRPERGRCSTQPAMRCDVDAQCGGGAATCIPTGRLATARLQTDAITFLTLNQN